MESLTGQKDLSENIKTNENRYSAYHIPGHSSSKKSKVLRKHVDLTNAFATSANPRLLETSSEATLEHSWFTGGSS